MSVGEAVNRVGANLVVVASHAKGALDAFWSGSLTPKLIQTLGRPLLLVRAAEDAARPIADASFVRGDV